MSRSTFNILFYANMHLKGVVDRAHDNGKIQRNIFAQFHISPKCKERTYLTEAELKTVMTHEFEDKTDVPYQVKLLDVPLQIIERYRTFPKENPKSVFGEVNYWSVCKKLKTVMKECGIEKSISAHCARHGFATMALTNGMPIESVSRVLGHTNIVTTQIYARITTKKLDNDLTMLGNKLNASFSNIKTA